MNPSFLLRTTLYIVIVMSLVVTVKILVAIYSFDDESTTADDENSFDVIKRNDTASLDIIGKSEAVQSWLAKKQEPRKPLSEVESSLRVDEAAQLSARRNPKFEAVVDPEIERLQNQVHQFKFMQ